MRRKVPENYHISTAAIHAGEEEDEYIKPVSPPIYQSNAFSFSSAEEGARAFSDRYGQFVYTRLGNPTIRALEEKLSVLERAEASIAMASGMGAISGAILGLADGSAHVLSFNTVYGGTFKLLNKSLRPLGIETTFINPVEQDRIEDYLLDEAKIIYMESPMNPSLELLDIERMAEVARKHGAITVFDNTFATPCCQRPLEMGVDIVLHSASKYLCGHGDALGGMISGPEKLITLLRDKIMVSFGGVISPFNAWLILRGMQTLPLRMKRHCENAQAIAGFLSEHAGVSKVNYPGLECFPQKDLAVKQMSGYGGVLSFELAGGYESALRFIDGLSLCKISASLGDTKTLVIHPASMSHRAFSKEERERAGVTDGLVRIAVGLEDHVDLIDDIDQALQAIL